MKDSQEYISTRQAAQLLQIHESSVRRWCNEGLLACAYTAGGHRRIPLGALLELAQTQALPCRLLTFSPYEASLWRGIQDVRRREDYTALITLVYGWLADGPSHLLAPLLTFLLEMGFTTARLFDYLLEDVTDRIGDGWHRGLIEIGEEHRMTEAIRSSLYYLLFALPQRAEGRPTEAPHAPHRPRTMRPVAIVGCARTEDHELGALMTRILLEDTDWNVVYLGRNVPSEDFALQQRKHRASLLCVSMSPPLGRPDAQNLIRVLESMSDPKIPYRLALGGRVFDADGPLPASRILDVSYFRQLTSFVTWLTRPDGEPVS